MPAPSRFVAIGIGVGILAVAIGLLIGGWLLGLSLAPRLDRTSASLVNLIFALTPGALVLVLGHRKTIAVPLTALAILLVVMIATLNIHAGAWTGPHLRPGSVERLLTVLSALIWPALAAGAFGAAVSRRTGERFGRTASFLGTVALVGVHATVVFLMIRLLAGMLPAWSIVVIVVAVSLVVQLALESEIGLWIVRRSSVEVPLSVANVKSEVEAETKILADGPIVVDRGEEMSAEIRWRVFRRPMLILSAAMARADAAALKAVVAHEYAHVALGHVTMRLWLAVGSLCLLAGAMTTLTQAAGFNMAARPIAGTVTVTVALVSQRLLLSAYLRRQEREADHLATAIAGADAMSAALRMTSAGPVIPSSFSFWLTHDSLEDRRRALEARVSITESRFSSGL